MPRWQIPRESAGFSAVGQSPGLAVPHLDAFVLISHHAYEATTSVDTISLLIDDSIHAFQQFDDTLADTQASILQEEIVNQVHHKINSAQTYSYSSTDQRVILGGDIGLQQYVFTDKVDHRISHGRRTVRESVS